MAKTHDHIQTRFRTEHTAKQFRGTRPPPIRQVGHEQVLTHTIFVGFRYFSKERLEG